MKQLVLMVCLPLILSCNNNSNQPQSKDGTEKTTSTASNSNGGKKGHWEGSFTNGMKETYISFDVSEDGKELQNLTFRGYWRCDGKLDQTTLGPEKSFIINGNKVDGTITEPENGGATAIRYEIHGMFNGDSAEGSFRMNINALACDTYVLNWKAERK
jgi:hypothetical protein